MTPIFYSFRRCPYAMRARLAVKVARIETELREIVLRDKAPEFLAASPKGTVPVMVVGETVIEESLDIMQWALGQNDPEGWMEMPAEWRALIETMDGEFKTALDRTKYASRYLEVDASEARDVACQHLMALEAQLTGPWLFGEKASLADMATLPFVRQFAHIDKPWFDAQPWPNLSAWLERFLASDLFTAIMDKHPKWQAGDAPTPFP